VLERQTIAREVEARVQQHRRVPTRQHEAVAVEPFGVRRVVLQVLCEELVREWRERHRRARMSGLRLLYGIHAQRADRVDRELINVHALRNYVLGRRDAAGLSSHPRFARAPGLWRGGSL